jgi:TRAP-type C4-dicarboxylate transport system permease small subunit
MMAALDRCLYAAMRMVCMACMVLLFLIVTMSVVNRFAGLVSMGWSDEIIELLFAWLVFLGSACLWRDRAHFGVDLLPGLLQGRWKWWLGLLTQVLGIAFLLLLVYHGWNLLGDASDNSPVFAISKRYWYGVMPLAGTVMIVYSLRDIWLALRDGPAGAKPLD